MIIEKRVYVIHPVWPSSKLTVNIRHFVWVLLKNWKKIKIALNIREGPKALMKNCAKWKALFRELFHRCLTVTILVKQRQKEFKKAISQGNISGVLVSIYLSAKENQINLVNRHVKILNHPPSKDSVPCEAIKLSAEPELLWKELTFILVSENKKWKKLMWLLVILITQ